MNKHEPEIVENDDQDVIVMDKIDLPVPAIVAEGVKAGFDKVINQIKKEIEDHKPDITTKRGREKIKSLAYKISRTKTRMDKETAKLTEDQKAMIVAVNSERKEMRETLDELRDKARKPLNDWEKEDEDRIAEMLKVFDFLSYSEASHVGQSSETISTMVDEVRNLVFDEKIFQSRYDEVFRVRDQTLKVLETALANQQKYEKDQAELEQFRQDKLKREEEDRLKKLEEERLEEERLENIRIKEEEERAKKLAAEEAERIAAEKIRIAEEEKEQARLDAIQQQKDADEREARLKQEAAEREAELKRQAERREIEAKEEAEREKEEALELERSRIENERLRKERIAEEEQAAVDKRAADLKHRKRINKAILEAMVKSSDCSEDVGNMIILAIANGNIPHVKISY